MTTDERMPKPAARRREQATGLFTACALGSRPSALFWSFAILAPFVIGHSSIGISQAASFTYTLPSDGQVSLAVYESSGKLVRTLLAGEKQSSGPHVASWGGLDDNGKAVPAGQYQWRLLSTPGFSRELLVNVGVTTPWSLCDVWPGNHAGPTLVYVDADDALYVASVSSEGPPHLIKITPDGSKKFWDDGTWGNADGITGMVVVDGRLYLQAGKTVTVLNARSGNRLYNVTPPPGLTFPIALEAYDSANKQTLKVVDNTIQRFNADGSLAATHGGSRVYGKFDPQQFDTILCIACDSKGSLYVVEQFPRRVARFDMHGNLLNQWLGGLQWGSMAAFDPADPTIAYVPIDPLHWGKAKLDFANRSWTLTDLYPPIASSSTVNGKQVIRSILPGAPSSGYFEVRHVGGQTFLLNKQGNQQSGQSGVLVLRVDAEQLTPVAYLGSLHPSGDRLNLPPWWLTAQSLPATTQFTTYLHFAFSWADANGNGQVDTSEVRVASVGDTYNDTRVWSVDENWNLAAIVNGKLARIANEGTATLPKWDWDHTKSIPVVAAESVTQYRGTFSLGDGSLYAVAVAQSPSPDPKIPWPNRLNAACRLFKFDAAGQQAFAAGQHSLLAVPAPGTFADVRAIVGQARGNLVVMDASYPGHASVWTPDGLYAGSFEDDVDNAPSKVTQAWQALAYGNQLPLFPGNEEEGSIFNDTHWGQLFAGPDGTVCWGSMGVNSTPLYRITGFDGWLRLSGTVGKQ